MRKLVFLSVFAVLLAFQSCSPKAICDFALKPKKAMYEDIASARKTAESRYSGICHWYDSLCMGGVFRDTMIVGDSLVRLHAVFAGKKKAQGTALLIHGYGVNHFSMMYMARVYRDSLDMNVILPDLQYHGLSGGEAVQMGWFDRLDMKRWIDVACGLWKPDFMIVHGVSMGAATTMMLSGESDLPACVRAFVEDCGYSSVWDEFYYLRNKLLLSERKLRRVDDYCARTYGWSFDEASSINQLSKCDRPMLFIHGAEDSFVPSKFVYECYDAKTDGYKDIWVAQNAPRHALTYHDYPVEYLARLKSFIEVAREESVLK